MKFGIFFFFHQKLRFGEEGQQAEMLYHIVQLKTKYSDSDGEMERERDREIERERKGERERRS